MDNSGVILLCDNDAAVMQQIQSSLERAGYDIDMINDARSLIPMVIRLKPSVVIVNPDMQGFNEYDVCKNIMKDMNIPVILLLNTHSAARAQIDECPADDVITKPVKHENLANLVSRHISVHQ